MARRVLTEIVDGAGSGVDREPVERSLRDREDRDQSTDAVVLDIDSEDHGGIDLISSSGAGHFAADRRVQHGHEMRANPRYGTSRPTTFTSSSRATRMGSTSSYRKASPRTRCVLRSTCCSHPRPRRVIWDAGRSRRRARRCDRLAGRAARGARATLAGQPRSCASDHAWNRRLACLDQRADQAVRKIGYGVGFGPASQLSWRPSQWTGDNV